MSGGHISNRVRMSKGQFAEGYRKMKSKGQRRFVRPLDRDRYIFAHALLRSILSAYVGCAPTQLIFKNNQYGKPLLESTGDSNNIQFNLSHSENLILFAVARGARVGIDVEYMRNVSDARQIVNRFFSGDERKFLNSLPPADFQKGFFACWSSKEAFLKGLGQGLSYPLDKFSITFSKGESVGFLQIYDDTANACSWKILSLTPGQGYSGALAIEKIGSEPKFFQYCWE